MADDDSHAAADEFRSLRSRADRERARTSYLIKQLTRTRRAVQEMFGRRPWDHAQQPGGMSCRQIRDYRRVEVTRDVMTRAVPLGIVPAYTTPVSVSGRLGA